jgi:hypothetical protein
MPHTLTKATARLTGHCSIEEAEAVFAWLVKHPKCKLDLSGVQHLHAAVLQTMLVAANPVSKIPSDEFSAECVRQILPGTAMEYALRKLSW